MGKPTKILHNVAVGVVLNDVLDPLIAVLISATLRFSRMASSGLGNVDLSEVLFALENVDESPEIWVVCSYIRLETAMPTFNCIVSSWQVIYGLVVEYYDLDETYKDFVKILLTVHKRVYDMKHKMDIWFFQEEKNMKNISTKNTKVSA